MAAKLSLAEAEQAAIKNGIDMRMFKLEYRPGNQVDFGSVSTRVNLATGEPTALVQAADGRIVLNLYDEELRSEKDAVENIAHELNHVRTFQRTGRFSEIAAEAAAEKAGQNLK